MITTRRSPRQLIEGDGARAAVGPIAAQLGNRALMIVDPVIAQQPVYAPLIADLEAAGVDHVAFTDVRPEVPIELVA